MSLRDLRGATLSDLEFQRELSPAQIREALSLLDSTAGTQNQTVQIEYLRPAEEDNPEPDQSSTTMPMQDRPPAAEDPRQRRKHLYLYRPELTLTRQKGCVGAGSRVADVVVGVWGTTMCALAIRDDISPEELRRQARRERDGRVSARLIAIANALEGMDRASAARLAGM